MRCVWTFVFSFRTSAPHSTLTIWHTDVYHISEFSSSLQGYTKIFYDASYRKLECKEGGLSDIFKSPRIRSVFLWFLTAGASRALPVPLVPVPAARSNLLRPIPASLFESSSRQATMLRSIHFGAFCTIFGKFIFKLFTFHSEHTAMMSACFAHAQLLFLSSLSFWSQSFVSPSH